MVKYNTLFKLQRHYISLEQSLYLIYIDEIDWDLILVFKCNDKTIYHIYPPIILGAGGPWPSWRASPLNPTEGVDKAGTIKLSDKFAPD
jgi:hypothetical protein